MASQKVLDLHICIIGAGMAGLATALALAKQGFTHIDVYEYASSLGFVGAGIQLAPNMARILDRLGVWEEIEKEAVDLKFTSIRGMSLLETPSMNPWNGASDKELGHVDLTYVRSTYTYPHMVGHRSSLAGALYEGCVRESKTIHFNFSTTLTSIESFGPKPSFTIQTRSGETSQVTCDILLAADGVKSQIRDAMLAAQNISAKIIDTGQAAYRIMLTRQQLSHDPELLALLDAEAVTRWIGAKRHIIAYPVSNNQVYNISTLQPDSNFADAPSATYTTKGSKRQMLDVFGDFCPRIARMLDLVPEGEVCEWKLRTHTPLPTWTHQSTTLLGDASHPTLPHMAQGAAQAIEDAAVLAVCLSRIPDRRSSTTPSTPSPSDINRALLVYEKLRMERAYTIVDLAAENGRKMHLGEGEAKKERDREFAESIARGGKGGRVPDKWADAEVQAMVYGVDVWREAEEGFEGIYRSLG